MKDFLSSPKNRMILYAAVFVGILALYLLRATASGLWFDEAIEYYFSSTLRGPVPGARADYSMYRRILLTYQPPLYNWLMYLWLSVFDSEFWFRLAGILVTFLGGAGVYLALREITDRDWAAAGTAVYLLAGGVSEYALEAGEYNLMLCMMCWTVFFYLHAVRKETGGAILGFIAFACLAAYSQYGVVFLLVPMYGSVLLHFLKRKKHIRELLIGSLAAGIAAALLLRFFLIGQMQVQGSAGVSHTPVFAYGVADVFMSLARTLVFTFHSGKWIQLAVTIPAGLLLLFALPQKDRTLFRLLLLLMCSWVAYYFLTACSVYGYNGRWNPDQLGTANIGGRYSLMFAPLLAVTLVYGVYRFLKKRPEGSAKKWMAAALCLLIAYTAVGTWGILTAPTKDDVREATQAWYDEKAFNAKTLVNQWDDPIFQFYLTHHPDYEDTYQENVVLSSWWAGEDPKQMEKKLSSLKLLDAEDFYYISKVSEDYEHHYRVFSRLMEEHGFTVKEVYKGDSALVHVVKE